jgi:hypothetical protein
MKTIVALVFALLLLKSCALGQGTVKSDPDLQYPRIVSFVEVGESVQETFRVKFDFEQANFPFDALYVLPPTKHLTDVESFRRKLGLGHKWSRDSWDCDDQAREAMYLAKRWSKVNYVGVPATIAYGSAYVRIVGFYPLGNGMDRSPDAPGYHVLNVYLRNDGKWFFLEPQNGRTEEVLSLIYEGGLEVMRVEI